MKNSLYWLLSASSFVQTGKNEVFGVSNFFLAMSISAAIGAFGIGLGLDHSEAFPYLLPFLLLIAIYIIGKFTLGVVSKEIQDKHWRTQLVNFKDPKFAIQKSLYPGDANRRELALERKWFGTYWVEFDDTKAPWFQKARILILPMFGIIGLLLGILLR